MKRMTRLMTLILALCMVISLSAFASGEPSGEASAEPAIAPGTYTDGVCTLVIADDMTFSLEKTGENMDGAAFVLTVTGAVVDGAFVIDGLWDGEINLIDMATEEQKAADLASVESAFAGGASGEASEEPSGEAGIVPGTYTDGVNTLVIAEDMTFVMNKAGENMDGAAFAMTIKGVVEDGEFVITAILDGELDVFLLATAEQIAADTASVQAAYAG